MITINNKNIKILIIIIIFLISISILLTYKESLNFSIINDNRNDVFNLNKQSKTDILPFLENEYIKKNSMDEIIDTKDDIKNKRFIKSFSTKYNPLPSNVSYNLQSISKPNTDNRTNHKFLTIDEIMYGNLQNCSTINN
jgi:hypothetical protein